jgi:hypothetical protein
MDPKPPGFPYWLGQTAPVPSTPPSYHSILESSPVTQYSPSSPTSSSSSSSSSSAAPHSGDFSIGLRHLGTSGLARIAEIGDGNRGNSRRLGENSIGSNSSNTSSDREEDRSSDEVDVEIIDGIDDPKPVKIKSSPFSVANILKDTKKNLSSANCKTEKFIKSEICSQLFSQLPPLPSAVLPPLTSPKPSQFPTPMTSSTAVTPLLHSGLSTYYSSLLLAHQQSAARGAPPLPTRGGTLPAQNAGSSGLPNSAQHSFLASVAKIHHHMAQSTFYRHHSESAHVTMPYHHIF